MLTNVTLTGADDQTDPAKLVELSAEFPFVEWGLLIGSRIQTRMPSHEWFGRLIREIKLTNTKTALSVHLCGGCLREMLDTGTLVLRGEIDLAYFQRMQLNIRETIPEDRRDYVLDSICAVQASTKHEIIVRIDHLKNSWLLNALLKREVKASCLYDASHGEGKKPVDWPLPNPEWKVAYAGGLGPDNVFREAKVMQAIARGQSFSIDMESGARTGDVFDLQKCRSVLAACKELVGRAA